jgi:hypothetical protein
MTPSSDEERRALAKLTATLNPSDPPERILQTAIDSAKNWRGRKRRSRKARQQAVASVYDVYLCAQVNEKLRTAIEQACDRKKIRRTAASELAIVLVKLILAPPEASVAQYAAAVRQAAIESVGLHELGGRLATKGNGIDAMALRFWRMNPKKQTSRQRQHKNKIDAFETRKEVSLEWKPKALKKWKSKQIADGSKAYLIVRRITASRAKVIAVRRFRPDQGIGDQWKGTKEEPSAPKPEDSDDWE